MSSKDLMAELVKAENERMKIESSMFTKFGTSRNVRNMPVEKGKWGFKNLKEVKRQIARIKTFLSVKLKNVNNI